MRKTPVTYGPQSKIWNIDKAIDIDNNYVIIKNKELKKLKTHNFDIIKTGRKYSLLDKKVVK